MRKSKFSNDFIQFVGVLIVSGAVWFAFVLSVLRIIGDRAPGAIL